MAIEGQMLACVLGLLVNEGGEPLYVLMGGSFKGNIHRFIGYIVLDICYFKHSKSAGIIV